MIDRKEKITRSNRTRFVGITKTRGDR